MQFGVYTLTSLCRPQYTYKMTRLFLAATLLCSTACHLVSARPVIITTYPRSEAAPRTFASLDDKPDNTANVTALSSSQVDAFLPGALLAQAAYCVNASAALPTIEMLAVGGDGGSTPRCKHSGSLSGSFFKS